MLVDRLNGNCLIPPVNSFNTNFLFYFYGFFIPFVSASFVRSLVASADIYSETAIEICMYMYVVPCSVYKAPPDFAFCALLLCPARFVGWTQKDFVIEVTKQRTRKSENKQVEKKIKEKRLHI